MYQRRCTPPLPTTGSLSQRRLYRAKKRAFPRSWRQARIRTSTCAAAATQRARRGSGRVADIGRPASTGASRCKFAVPRYRRPTTRKLQKYERHLASRARVVSVRAHPRLRCNIPPPARRHCRCIAGKRLLPTVFRSASAVPDSAPAGLYFSAVCGPAHISLYTGYGALGPVPAGAAPPRRLLRRPHPSHPPHSERTARSVRSGQQDKARHKERQKQRINTQVAAVQCARPVAQHAAHPGLEPLQLQLAACHWR